jgi:hypothetical protein
MLICKAGDKSLAVDKTPSLEKHILGWFGVDVYAAIKRER